MSLPNPQSPIPNPSLTPNHIGFILDGNRRWAKAKGVSTFDGHKKGYDNLKLIAEACFDKGIKYVSAYIFSTENWNRSQDEVKYLMGLVLKIASKEIDSLVDNNIKVVFLGSRDKLSDKIIKAIDQVQEKSANNTGGTLALCFNYGGQNEIVDAVNSLCASGKLPPYSQQDVTDYIYSPDIPNMDLVVRTSGEMRLSNFMMWRSGYSELIFVDPHWPDFDTDSLDSVINEYTSRKRRFGK